LEDFLRPLERPMNKTEDNIKMNFRELDCEDGRFTKLAQDKPQFWDP
jgi:hypothetical protein